MNEMMLTGWIYMKTNAMTNDDALKEFLAKCEKIGIEANPGNFTEIIVRDSNGEDLTLMQKVNEIA